MTIKNIRDDLKKRLENIQGLNVHKHPPNILGKLPVAIIDWATDAADYVEPGNTTIWKFRILLLLGKFDAHTAYDSIDDYIEKTGDKSIKAIIEADEPGDYTIVTSCENVGIIVHPSGQNFYGAEFLVEVGDTT